MNFAWSATVLWLALATGCGVPKTAPTASTGVIATPAMPPPTAATVKLMTPGGELAGQAILTVTPTGVEIELTASGLKPGAHGFHIHMEGTCAPGPDATGKTIDFGAAGGHFDPGAAHKHGQPGNPANASHAGDLPNLTADPAGKASARYLNTQVTLGPGPTSVIGRSLVVHADPDDYVTEPAGNSGARVLCGRIEPAQVNSIVGQAN